LSGVLVLQLDVVVFFLDNYAEFSSLHSFGHEKYIDFPELQMLYLELWKIREFFMIRVDLDVVFFFLDNYAEFSSLHSFGHEKYVDLPELQMLYLELWKISEFFMIRVDAS
jgi:hypothetical protein